MGILADTPAAQTLDVPPGYVPYGVEPRTIDREGDHADFGRTSHDLSSA